MKWSQNLYFNSSKYWIFIPTDNSLRGMRIPFEPSWHDNDGTYEGNITMSSKNTDRAYYDPTVWSETFLGKYDGDRLSVEDELVKAAKIDGDGLFTVYWKILLPMMRPVFFTSFVILVHISIKSYDLIVALTQGGPGISTTMPALYMTQTAFHKSQVGLSAASAIMMFMAVAAVIIPYLYSELRRENAR